MTEAWAAVRDIVFSPSGTSYLAVVAGLLVLFSLMRFRLGLLVLVVLPGTLFHELAHLLASILFRGQATSFRLVPKRVGAGFILGSVTCANVRWYNGLFIGMAPILLLPLAFGLLLWRLSITHHLQLRELPWAYFIACLAYAAIPSRQDLQLVAKSRWMLLGVAAAACILWIWRSGDAHSLLHLTP